MAKVKGIDLLIQKLAYTECPNNYGLKDVKRKGNGGITCTGCVYGSEEYKDTCIECFKQAIELEYESEEE